MRSLSPTWNIKIMVSISNAIFFCYFGPAPCIRARSAHWIGILLSEYHRRRFPSGQCRRLRGRTVDSDARKWRKFVLTRRHDGIPAGRIISPAWTACRNDIISYCYCYDYHIWSTAGSDPAADGRGVNNNCTSVKLHTVHCARPKTKIIIKTSGEHGPGGGRGGSPLGRATATRPVDVVARASHPRRRDRWRRQRTVSATCFFDAPPRRRRRRRRRFQYNIILLHSTTVIGFTREPRSAGQHRRSQQPVASVALL